MKRCAVGLHRWKIRSHDDKVTVYICTAPGCGVTKVERPVAPSAYWKAW